MIPNGKEKRKERKAQIKHNLQIKNEMITKLMQEVRGQRSSSIQTRKPLWRLHGCLWKK